MNVIMRKLEEKNMTLADLAARIRTSETELTRKITGESKLYLVEVWQIVKELTMTSTEAKEAFDL